MFSFQIYCDFSGYSDIAIGTARLFGINLMRNFNLPYFSRDIAEFWRRWHISLTSWFRDYIYIPLGGSRCKKHKVIRNTFVIFLVSGFWHGAEWTFIGWGAYHAILFMPLIILGKNRRYTDTPAPSSTFPPFSESVMMAITFILVAIGWVIFRADTLSDALGYIGGMFSNFQFTPGYIGKRNFLYIGILLSLEWIYRKKNNVFDFNNNGLFKYTAARWCVYLIFAIMCLLLPGEQGQFIYFQF